ncbi:MAG: hypothetical protein FJ090_09470 [Deltaproteobacteria bacterium]|nr:hypothetical protein [Deltaproteobacteria bacterium]
MPLLLAAALAYPCDFYIYDDYSDGSTDGRRSGGTFVAGGWRPDGGTIVYDLPNFASGRITMRISNVDESGVSQHDLLELFSGADGSFSDSRRDNFVQVKFAGDIYDGYDGRVKLQAGPEFYGDIEVGSWTSEFDWQVDGAYDITVSWGDTSGSLDVGGVMSTSIDYSYYGTLTMATLRVPNDGSYARDGLMDDIVIAGVSLCTDDPGRDTPITPDDTETEDDAGSSETNDTPETDDGGGDTDGAGTDTDDGSSTADTDSEVGTEAETPAPEETPENSTAGGEPPGDLAGLDRGSCATAGGSASGAAAWLALILSARMGRRIRPASPR